MNAELAQQERLRAYAAQTIIRKWGNSHGKMIEEKHKVACGNQFMAAIRPDGRVVTYGFLPDHFDVSRWTDMVHLSAIEEGMIGLTSDGKVYAAGCVPTGRYSPVPMCRNSEDPVVATDIEHAEYAGGFFVNLCRKDGTECHIDLSNGEIGEGFKAYQGPFAPPTVTLRPDGTVGAEGLTEEKKKIVDTWTDLSDVAAGTVFVLGMKKDGSIVSAGSIYPACMNGESELNRMIRE